MTVTPPYTLFLKQTDSCVFKWRFSDGGKTLDNKRPLFEGGTVLETYGDKRFQWNRSSKYKGAFGAWPKFAEIRKKLKAFV